MARNYYMILGIPSDASQEEIRDAYRRLAKASHPDVSGADSGERFREVQEAWETLADTERRRAYDATLKPVQRQLSRPPRPQDSYRVSYPSQASAFDLFEDLLNELGGTYVSAAGGQEIHYGLQMTRAEAATGGELPLQIPLHVRCPKCAGRGSHFFFLCPACGGAGYRSYWQKVTLQVPPGLRNHSTLEVPLAELGLPEGRLILHAEIDTLQG